MPSRKRRPSGGDGEASRHFVLFQRQRFAVELGLGGVAPVLDVEPGGAGPAQRRDAQRPPQRRSDGAGPIQLLYT
ncbi:MAG: hypothetical protein GY717_13860 [Rhodobacteraceae bacterium]|nr:hypothetical protein [Paracoccaceae bacterium]